MDDTHLRIMKAAMDLVTEKGYASMTTKEIARRAGVNESTLFRKFKGKEDIVVTAMDYEPWHPHITKDMFKNYTGELAPDLCKFARIYLDHVTPYFVSLSIGLRSPELYQYTSQKIMQVPQTFLDGFKSYLLDMQKQRKIKVHNIDAAAAMFLSMCFGFVFFKASFEDNLIALPADDYLKTGIEVFLDGIRLEHV